MKQPIFTGACTALVTPFAENGLDYSAFFRLLDRQIQAKIGAVVVCGTTGEASTMTDQEQQALISACVQRANHACRVIAGTGTNDTAHAVRKSKAAADAGADALLVVTPYYNKCSKTGLIRHYEAIADAVHIPVILYNVPSRTGVSMTPEQYAILAQHPNIVGVKEAGGSTAQVSRTIALCGPEFSVWSGNDDQIVSIMALGGQGVISVLSNLAPELVQEIASLCQRGDYPQAAQLQNTYMDLIDALFCEVNPIPIKEALRLKGLLDSRCRLPLNQISTEGKLQLTRAMIHHGLL